MESYSHSKNMYNHPKNANISKDQHKWHDRKDKSERRKDHPRDRSKHSHQHKHLKNNHSRERYNSPHDKRKAASDISNRVDDHQRTNSFSKRVEKLLSRTDHLTSKHESQKAALHRSQLEVRNQHPHMQRPPSPRSNSSQHKTSIRGTSLRMTKRALQFFSDHQTIQRRKELLQKHSQSLAADWSCEKVHLIMQPSEGDPLQLNYLVAPPNTKAPGAPRTGAKQTSTRASYSDATNGLPELAVPLQELMVLHPAEGLKQWRNIFTAKRMLLESYATLLATLLEHQPSQREQHACMPDQNQ
jgi:hypothetical protein